MRLALIGVPSNSSGLISGEARAPSVLRAAGLLDALRKTHDVADYGEVALPTPTPDRDPASGIIDPHGLAAVIDGTRELVARALADNRLPVVVGGDCPLLLGCLAAARDHFGRVGLLFVDGHEDAWPPRQSTTGEAADMELGLALGLTATPELTQLAAQIPLIRPDDAVVLGPRDLDELTDAGVPSIAAAVPFMDDRTLRTMDIPTTVTGFTRRLERDVGHWWFHVDLDVLSTEAMPAVAYQQAGGLTWDELAMICEAALTAPGLIGWDITIFDPDRDPDGRSAKEIVAFAERVSTVLA